MSDGRSENTDVLLPLIFALWHRVENNLNQLQEIIYTHFMQNNDMQEKKIEVQDKLSNVSDKIIQYEEQVSSFSKWKAAMQLTYVTEENKNTPSQQSSTLLQKSMQFFSGNPKIKSTQQDDKKNVSSFQYVAEVYQQWEACENSADSLDSFEKVNKLKELKKAVDDWFNANSDKEPRFFIMAALQKRVNNSLYAAEEMICDDFLQKQVRQSNVLARTGIGN
ncbi:MAG: hypothetical protein JO131_05075 [Gammaproteobacteria bacterium]|nr:hypothetical protein [Gammaproteobacteria bacterium]